MEFADPVLLEADLDRTDPLGLGALPIEMVWIDGAEVKTSSILEVPDHVTGNEV